MQMPTPEQIRNLDPNNHITRDYRAEFQRMGRASLFFFAKYLFGRSALNNRAHMKLCHAAQRVIREPKSLGVMEDPRATGKSHAITIPGPAWCLIQDENECKRKGWLPLGPGSNIIVASYKTPFATIFTDETRKTIASNPYFLWLWGEMVPPFMGDKLTTWSKEMFTVHREKGSGYSVMAIGTESAATSLHPHVLFIDDLINEHNYKSATEVRAQVDWVSHSTNLTDVMRGSRVIVQNEWSERGVNADLREQNIENPHKVFFFSRSRVVCEVCESGRELDQFGNPIVCSHPSDTRPLLDTHLTDMERPYTMEDVDELKRTLPRDIWFAQHDNNPLAMSERVWQEKWLRYYTLRETAEGSKEYEAILLTRKGGLSGPQGTPDPDRLTYVPIKDMHVITALDPGLNRPGLVTIGRAFVPAIGDMLFLLEETAKKMSARDQFFTLFDWVLKWGADNMAFENVALQDYIRQSIPMVAEAYERERGVRLPHWVKRPNPDAKRLIGVRAYKREGDKTTRIRSGLSPLAEQRLIAIQRVHTGFIDEYVIFDKGKHMDLLDAVVMAIKGLKVARPMSGEERDRIRVAGIAAKEQYVEANPGAYGYGEGV